MIFKWIQPYEKWERDERPSCLIKILLRRHQKSWNSWLSGQLVQTQFTLNSWKIFHIFNLTCYVTNFCISWTFIIDSFRHYHTKGCRERMNQSSLGIISKSCRSWRCSHKENLNSYEIISRLLDYKHNPLFSFNSLLLWMAFCWKTTCNDCVWPLLSSVPLHLHLIYWWCV